jgi:hypothetical protein
MGGQLAWVAVVPRMVPPVVGRWDHEGTSATEVVAATIGIVGNGPIVFVEDDAAVLFGVSISGGTSVEHP